MPLQFHVFLSFSIAWGNWTIGKLSAPLRCWLKGMQGYVLNLQSSTHQRCFLDTLKWDQMGIGQMDGAETKQPPSKAGPKWCPNFGPSQPELKLAA